MLVIAGGGGGSGIAPGSATVTDSVCDSTSISDGSGRSNSSTTSSISRISSSGVGSVVLSLICLRSHVTDILRGLYCCLTVCQGWRSRFPDSPVMSPSCSLPHPLDALAERATRLLPARIASTQRS